METQAEPELRGESTGQKGKPGERPGSIDRNTRAPETNPVPDSQEPESG